MTSLDRNVLSRFRTWRYDPVAFVRDVVDVEPSNQQLEGLIAVRDGTFKGRKISVRSGHGTGKDAWVSWLILWFMATREDAKIACTAPTARQLQDILWSELGKWIKRSEVRDLFEKQKQKMFYKGASDTWWCRTISPGVSSNPEEQAETLAGLHGDHFMVIVDEASGVLDPVYTTLEGALTQEDNWAILIGNMTKNVGYFYDTHFHVEHSKQWQRLHWDSRKSSNVNPSYCEYMRVKYGEDSNVYRIRVCGDPPLEDEKTLIPLAWSMQCIGNAIEVADEEPLYLGVDVARFGDDASIILPRQGLIVDPWETFRGMNTISLASHVKLAYESLEAEGAGIDEIGIGAGVVDWLHKHNFRDIFGVNVALAASDLAKYDRLRDELWLRVREKCMKGLYSFPTKLTVDGIPMGQELAEELAAPRYDFNAHGGYKVESKKDMKKRGVASPNIADALCLTEYFESVAFKIFSPEAKAQRLRQTRRRHYDSQGVANSDAWMVR